MTDTKGFPGVRFAVEPGDFIYILAQNQESSGSVTCEITVDGIRVSKNTSTAAYGIAQCDGTAE